MKGGKTGCSVTWPTKKTAHPPVACRRFLAQAIMSRYLTALGGFSLAPSAGLDSRLGRSRAAHGLMSHYEYFVAGTADGFQSSTPFLYTPHLPFSDMHIFIPIFCHLKPLSFLL